MANVKALQAFITQSGGLRPDATGKAVNVRGSRSRQVLPRLKRASFVGGHNSGLLTHYEMTSPDHRSCKSFMVSARFCA